MAMNALVPVPNEEDAKKLAQRIMPQFPKDLNQDQAIEVARVALAYGLDPMLGELIPYQGKPYITFDGRIRVADNHPAYDGYDLVPPTDAEMKALRPTNGESIWKCLVYRKDRSRPTVAYGRAGGANERNPVGKSDPVTMAQKRAIHRALRAAFPVPIPGVETEVTGGQIKAIHAMDDDLGITVTERHEALEAQFGVRSSTELTAGQASAYLDQRAASVTPDGEIIDVTPERGDGPDQLITKERASALWAKAKEIGWGMADIRRAIPEVRIDRLGDLTNQQHDWVLAAIEREKDLLLEAAATTSNTTPDEQEAFDGFDAEEGADA